MKFIRDPIIDSSGKVTGLLFFAIKEAFSKSLGLGFRTPCFPKDISVQRDKMGKPEIFPKNELYKYMKEKFGNFLIHVSLSDTKKYSIASVIIEKT